MKHTTLVVMAAGMGSRYGGIKQLDSFGPDGEIIMDYSIYDAIRAGFDKVVIIIRKDIEEDFMRVIGNRLKEKAGVPVIICYQDKNDLPEGFTCPADRSKPWGTGHAVLSAAPYVSEPFLVINADDFYGAEPYRIVHDFLVNTPEDEVAHFCMAGYDLVNTLSDNGTVARGISTVDEKGNLVSIEETYQIGRGADGVIRGEGLDGSPRILSTDDIASMNMMGFTPAILDRLRKDFVTFLQGLDTANPLKAEFLLPQVVTDMLHAGQADMKVLRTAEKWYGVTYQEDKPAVRDAFRRLTAEGVYKERLWD